MLFEEIYILQKMSLLIADQIHYEIIVLKDDNGNGGNVYVDPDVTRVHATVFADKIPY